MRYMIGSQIAWGVVPALVLVGAAYLWLAGRLFGRKTEVETREHETSVRKAA